MAKGRIQDFVKGGHKVFFSNFPHLSGHLYCNKITLVTSYKWPPAGGIEVKANFGILDYCTITSGRFMVKMIVS